MEKSSQIPCPSIVWPAGNAPATSRVFAQNVIDVMAPPEVVWSLLTDCVGWPQWYTHCKDVSILRGGPLLGANSKFRFKTLNLYFEPEVTACIPQRMLVWHATGPLGSSGAHAWYIERTEGGCRVVTEETQRGIPSLLLGWHTQKLLLAIHQDWLEGLKTLADSNAVQRAVVSDHGSVQEPAGPALRVGSERSEA